MRVTIGFKTKEEFKEKLIRLAEKENRSLSNFIKNALKTYIKDYHEEEK